MSDACAAALRQTVRFTMLWLCSNRTSRLSILFGRIRASSQHLTGTSSYAGFITYPKHRSTCTESMLSPAALVLLFLPYLRMICHFPSFGAGGKRSRRAPLRSLSSVNSLTLFGCRHRHTGSIRWTDLADAKAHEDLVREMVIRTAVWCRKVLAESCQSDSNGVTNKPSDSVIWLPSLDYDRAVLLSTVFESAALLCCSLKQIIRAIQCRFHRKGDHRVVLRQLKVAAGLAIPCESNSATIAILSSTVYNASAILYNEAAQDDYTLEVSSIGNEGR